MGIYNLPFFMKVEEDAVERLIENIKNNFPKKSKEKILLLTTEGIRKTLTIQLKLIEQQIEHLEIKIIKRNSFDFAVDLAKYICMNNIQIILGFGGGTVLDTAKFASFISKTIYISIPTTLSNDGLASPIAVLYTKNQRKKSFGSKIPDGLIIDINIILNAPRLLLKAGVGDTMSNYSSLYDWKLSCRKQESEANDFAYMLSEMSFNQLLYSEEKSLESKLCIKMLAQSLVLSGLAMQIAGNSRPCSGSEHLFAHAMDELYDFKMPHGILVALGSTVSTILQRGDNKILLDYLKAYDISINPQKLRISEEMFVSAWMFARETRKERFTILDEIKLNPELFKKIYKKLLEVY